MIKNKLSIISVEIKPEMLGNRLDKGLSSHPEILTRSRAEYLIKNSHVNVNGKILVKTSYEIKSSDQILITLPEKKESVLQPLDLELEILFEDSDLIVLNKPSGLVVHPAAGHEQDTLVNALLFHTQDLSMKFGESRPGIIHRIDKDTSGLLVVAKNDFTHENLAIQFKEKKTHRVYYAACIGVLNKQTGTIKSYLARDPNDRKRYASTAETNCGKLAITHYEIIETVRAEVSLLKLKLETGRTHQIRVHLSESQCPIIADPIYLNSKKLKSIKSTHFRELIKNFPRLALHAAELGFIHPKTNEFLMFKVPWPKALLKNLTELGFTKL